MKTYRIIALSMFVGSIFGAGAIQCLHAQSKPPAYVIGQIEVTNQEAYKTDDPFTNDRGDARLSFFGMRY
jgi:hypothetical protein